jgi:hypothetical protein
MFYEENFLCCFNPILFILGSMGRLDDDDQVLVTVELLLKFGAMPKEEHGVIGAGRVVNAIEYLESKKASEYTKELKDVLLYILKNYRKSK